MYSNAWGMLSMTIRVPTSITAERAARLTAEVVDGTRQLRVPARVSFKSGLSVSQVTQAIITWGVRPTPGVLVTDLDVSDPHASRTLARNTPLLAAIQLADTVQDEQGVDITTPIRALSTHTLETVTNDIPQLAMGTAVGSDRVVMAVDHNPRLTRPRGMYPLGPIDESSRPLYAGRLETDATQSRGRLPLGHRALGVSGQKPESWGSNYSAAGAALGMLLFELIQNTDIHARTTVDGKALPRSIRLLHVRSVSQPRTVLSRSEPENRALSNYLLTAGEPHRAQQRLLVVSVLDSGPGLAATMLRRENILASPSPAHELRYLLRALRMTSSGSTREPMRGLGLRRVHTFLTALGGYAKVRSGRYELERDFLRFPYQDTGDSERSWWGGVQAPSVKPQLAGAAFTLVIPIPPGATAEQLWEAAAHGG